MGCVYGISSAAQNLAMGVGTLLSGVLVIYLGAREVFIGVAGIMLLLAIIAFILLNRSIVSRDLS